jgi:predicted Rossmann fold flavoprotein
VRRVLRAFTAAEAASFFREMGVALHAEEDGKLFPNTNRSRSVLDALLREAERKGVILRAGQRVLALARRDGGFELEMAAGPLRARRVVLATGGLALPKTGSDGLGYRLAESLGHSLVATTPALAPLVLEGSFHAPLSGLSCDVEILMRARGRDRLRLRGPMLFTHFGMSGPVALNVSRHWLRARLEGREIAMSASFLPAGGFEEAEKTLLALARSKPRATLQNALAALVPAALAAALLRDLQLEAGGPLSQLSREARRAVSRALTEWPLRVKDSRGYDYAEVTAGGVPLEEIDARTMESRKCPGLHLVGEILDVDGRIGGFNFQWAWSSAFVAARGLEAGLAGA